MSAGTSAPYLGSKISLISKSEIRYEGILYTINPQESTVALAKVKSHGTEDRPTDRPVLPREEIYEYIIFRGSDIRDIRVCHPPKPQPTLEGGLPNDPAIVQHSMGTSGASQSGSFSGSGAQNPVPSVPVGSQGYGPIGSSSYGSSAPVATNVQAGQRTGTSPVMDLLRDSRSGNSSPAVVEQQPSPAGQEGGRPSSRGHDGNLRGRGNVGFYRGGRGRGGGQNHGQQHHHQQQQQQPHQQQQQYRGRGGHRGGGFQPGRPTANKKEPLKFDDEYDFDKANEEFKVLVDKLQKSSLESKKSNGSTSGEVADSESADKSQNGDDGVGEVVAMTKTGGGDEAGDDFIGQGYDRTKSFFDNISCEAMEKSKGNASRPDWREEKKLNRETFGAAGNIGRRGYYNNNYRGRFPRNNYRGGYNSGRRGGGGGYNNAGYNNGRFARDGGNRNFHGNRGGGRGRRGNRGWVQSAPVENGQV